MFWDIALHCSIEDCHAFETKIMIIHVMIMYVNVFKWWGISDDVLTFLSRFTFIHLKCFVQQEFKKTT